MPSARVTFLGTGTSHGVPMIGCQCAVCRSDDPRDRRLRPSIYVDVAGGPGLLVDTATDSGDRRARVSNVSSSVSCGSGIAAGT